MAPEFRSDNKQKEKACHLPEDGYLRKVVWIGLAVNIILAGLKFTAGIVGSSQAVVADSVHSLSDCVTDIAVIMGSYIWSKPADDDHPYGHRRLETAVTLFIGTLLLIAGLGIGGHAIASLQQGSSKPPGWPALAAAVISLIGKEILYQWTVFTGRRVKSVALTANAWHHRLDAISSIPVIAAVAGAMIFPSWTFIDRVGAIVVAILIIQVAFKIIWPGINEMLEVGAPVEICRMIEKIALVNSQVVQVHKIRTRYVGADLHVDMHVLVDGSISVWKGHDIADDVKNRIIKDGPDVLDVVVHIEPNRKDA